MSQGGILAHITWLLGARERERDLIAWSWLEICLCLIMLTNCLIKHSWAPSPCSMRTHTDRALLPFFLSLEIFDEPFWTHHEATMNVLSPPVHSYHHQVHSKPQDLDLLSGTEVTWRPELVNLRMAKHVKATPPSLLKQHLQCDILSMSISGWFIWCHVDLKLWMMPWRVQQMKNNFTCRS